MEDLCVRCTICCYQKILKDEGSVVYTDRPCEYLDLDSGLCIVYESRTSMKENCVEITQDVVRLGALPRGCPYVAHVKGYHAPRLTRRLEKLAERKLRKRCRKGKEDR